jgi:hypothetical protein
MKTNFTVNEYGIKKKNGLVYPEHYSWEYCMEKKIPYILIHPKIKYTRIEYDLFPVDNGLGFPKQNKLIDYWWGIYEKYMEDVSFPESKIPMRIIGEVTDFFIVYKTDQFRIVESLMKEIEYFTNKYAVLDFKRKKYYEEIRVINELVKRNLGKK